MSKVTNPQHLLWEEKYRPNKLDDVIIPASLKESLKVSIAEGAIPTMLLYSPSPGTGKTTVCHAICNELDIKPLFINASLDNSIDDIRMKVVQYATTANMFNASKKVVILDEAERLSNAAQESLKGLIELVSSNCSFLLSSNSKSRIIEPLRSRCQEVDFVYSTADQNALAAQMAKRLFEILTEEGVTFDKTCVIQVVKKFAPDNRKILKVLQAYSKENNKVIDSGILGKIKGADAEALIESMKAKKYDDVKAWCMNNFDRLGDDFYGRFFKTLDPILVPQSVPQVVLILNEYQRHHQNVPDRFVHFLAMMTSIMIDCTFK